MVTALAELFPRLASGDYSVTSPKDDDYNCIAWAAGETKRWWWPGRIREDDHWPVGVPCAETPVAFEAAFATLGYTACDSEELEAGFEKTAVYADEAGEVTHAARQLSSGRWTSKLGELEDIEHALRDLEGAEFGAVVLVMRRPLPVAAAPQNAATPVAANLDPAEKASQDGGEGAAGLSPGVQP